jgi:predicted dehydrogenase
MKILILGVGSIGLRHLKNTFSLFPNASVFVLSRSKTEVEGFPSVKVYNSFEQIYQNQIVFDAAIVATPTANHVNDCLRLIELGIKKIYVEKPISNNFNNLLTLKELAKHNNIQIFVGFDLKFETGLAKVKTLITDKSIGNLISFQAEVGQYLPDWRPETNYKQGMSAKIELGGGVMLDLIHEFDYLSWLLGGFKKIYGLNKKINRLSIETEGISVNILESNSGVLGVLSLDYIQKDLHRSAKFIGDNGTIEWNYVTSSVKWKNHQDKDWNVFNYSQNRNDRFLTSLKAFFDANTIVFDEKLTVLNEGITSLENVIKAKDFNISQNSNL